MSRYTRWPEPYPDPPLSAPVRRRAAQDPLLLARDRTGDQSTEFSYVPGPVAPHLNGLPPSEGGAYMPRSPRVDPPTNGIGRPRQHRRSPSEARGYPGEQVAR